jgi:hypothetical protein
MTSLTLKLEVLSGSAIEEAAAEALRVANILKIPVEFDFNNVRCVITYADNNISKVENLVKSYHEECMSKKKYKFALA